jgi:hypothetical protein
MIIKKIQILGNKEIVIVMKKMYEYNLQMNLNGLKLQACAISIIETIILYCLLVGRQQFWIKFMPTNCQWS